MCEIPEGHKKCTKCGEVKAFGEFYKDKENKNGIKNYCKSCSIFMSKMWAINNPEKNKKRTADWRKNNHEKDNKLKSKHNEKSRKTLDDRFIKQELIRNSNLKFSDISQEMIELKRVQLQIHRHLKEMTK